MVAICLQVRHALRLGRCRLESESEIPALLQPAAAYPETETWSVVQEAATPAAYQ